MASGSNNERGVRSNGRSFKRLVQFGRQAERFELSVTGRVRVDLWDAFVAGDLRVPIEILFPSLVTEPSGSALLLNLERERADPLSNTPTLLQAVFDRRAVMNAAVQA
jgi:hypothetical protein